MPQPAADADVPNDRAGLLNRLRLAPKVALLGILLLVLAGVAIAAYSERLYRAQSRQEAEVQADMLAASVRSALAFGDYSIAGENVRSLSANRMIEAAGVYSADGSRVAGFARGGASLPAFEAASTDDDHLTLVRPVIADGEIVGQVRVRTRLEPIAQRAARHFAVILLAAMGGLVAIVVVAAAAALRRSNAELVASNDRLRAEMAERAKAEEQLRQAQKMQAVGQLTGGIAHDFNNLLTPIMGGLEIIASVASDARVRSLASNALEAARRGAKLTGQLLAFSRTHRLDTVAVRVNDVIDGMQGMLRHSIGPTVDVRLALDPGCGSAMCDANQIENAVLNLAINARDAMPDGGTLTIATERMTVDASGELAAGDYVAVSVADTGTGMAPDVLARAAEPFFTTKEIGKGTGLGLAQVYGVAHQFGGTVRIESQVGEGTTVRILLPAVQSGIAQAAAAADGPAVVANRHPGAEILVVDDDADVRDFLTSTLEALGYRVHSATNGDEGLQLLGRTSPDMMLVDYAMPGLNGAEVARAARSARPNLPIVFVTGYADSDALHEAVGPTAPVLHKPFGVRELARVVERNFVHDAAA